MNIKNEIAIDLTGDLDLSLLKKIEQSFNNILNLSENYPEVFDKIALSIIHLSNRFNELFPDQNYMNGFIAMILAGLTLILVAFDLFKKKLISLQKIKINFDINDIKEKLKGLVIKIDFFQFKALYILLREIKIITSDICEFLSNMDLQPSLLENVTTFIELIAGLLTIAQIVALLLGVSLAPVVAAIGIILMAVSLIWLAIENWGEAIASWWNDHIAPWFTKEKWLEIFQPIEETFLEIWNNIIAWFDETIVAFWDEHIAPWFTKEKWLEIFQSIEETFLEIWNNIIAWFDETIVAFWDEHIAPWFTKEKWLELFQSVISAVSTWWDNSFGTIKEKLSKWWEEDIKPWFTVEKWSSLAQDALSGLKSWFKMPKISFDVTYSQSPKWLAEAAKFIGLKGIPKFNVDVEYKAAGGLVDPGQFFIARESGPELVGNFGSKTAVMNNNQIVESVSQGVYQAVAAALSGKSSSDQPLNIVLKVGETDFGKIAVNSINSLSRVQGSVNLAI